MYVRSLFLTVFAVMLMGSPAQASKTMIDVNSVAVSTASVQVAPLRTRRTYLLIQNVCANNIGISLTDTTAAIGTAKTITLFPGGSLEFKDDYVPSNAINAISASGSCGVTIWEIHG